MIDLTGVEHHKAITEIVDVLCNKTQNTDRGFFQVEAAYFLGKMASNQRAAVITKDRGEIPVNIYALALATSGFGKGHSVGIFEDELLAGFRTRFMDETMSVIAEEKLRILAQERSLRDNSDEEAEFEKVKGEYRRLGAYPFTFDSGTTPAVKQLRNKLLMGKIGAINLQIDEIGSNLVGNVEVLTTFLELYDQGKTKNKLTKNTNDNVRSEDLDGKTPANMLLFGAPSKLFDGATTEDEFYSFLETGYARRCIFGIGHQDRKAFYTMDPAEIYRRQTQVSNNQTVQDWATKFTELAAPERYEWKAVVLEDVGIKLVEYKVACERAADQMADHEEIRKAELSHRYFKALKLAGAYAFVDGTSQVTMDQLLSAILLVEESGQAFQQVLTREKSYMKLARYISECATEVTHADLNEALRFYKSGNAARNEMMTMATAWAYRQHIIIKKRYSDGIEFFSGETLKKTDLNNLILSHSDHFAYHYEPELAPFDQLHVLMEMPNRHWANHCFRDKHRSEENANTGFNMIVIDVDGGIALETVHDLLKEYTFMTYTTKRHTDEDHRFRLIMPINYVLHLDSDEYKEFMNSVMAWLPFTTDESANQRSKKWLTCENTRTFYNEGTLLDALPFIPRTARNEQHIAANKQVESYDNLERWFAQRIATGNRNNHMLKYAMVLADSGLTFQEVHDRVLDFNKKLANSLPEDELESTVLKSVAKKYI